MTARVHIVPTLRDNYAYIIEGEDKRCIIVDPGQVSPIEHFIDQHGLAPSLILNTHHHADHVAGNDALKKKFGIPVYGPKAEADKIPRLDGSFSDGDVAAEIGIEFQIISTPGHTAGHIVFYAPSLNALFSGDTLFSLGCGRLFEGTANEMYDSLQKLKNLPPETMIYCGHEYTESNGTFALHVDPENKDLQRRMAEIRKLRSNDMPTIPVSMETELKTNPFLRVKDAAQFTQLRAQKDSF